MYSTRYSTRRNPSCCLHAKVAKNPKPVFSLITTPESEENGFSREVSPWHSLNVLLRTVLEAEVHSLGLGFDFVLGFQDQGLSQGQKRNQIKSMF